MEDTSYRQIATILNLNFPLGWSTANVSSPTFNFIFYRISIHVSLSRPHKYYQYQILQNLGNFVYLCVLANMQIRARNWNMDRDSIQYEIEGRWRHISSRSPQREVQIQNCSNLPIWCVSCKCTYVLIICSQLCWVAVVFYCSI